MQNRMGPSFTGPSGILQPVADFIKMLTKEEITPCESRRNVYRFAPILALSVLIFALCFLPIDGSSVIPGVSFAGDLIFVMALVSVANFLLFLAGWSIIKSVQFNRGGKSFDPVSWLRYSFSYVGSSTCFSS